VATFLLFFPTISTTNITPFSPLPFPPPLSIFLSEKKNKHNSRSPSRENGKKVKKSSSSDSNQFPDGGDALSHSTSSMEPTIYEDDEMTFSESVIRSPTRQPSVANRAIMQTDLDLSHSGIEMTTKNGIAMTTPHDSKCAFNFYLKNKQTKNSSQII
jgi:hypothetical protein